MRTRIVTAPVTSLVLGLSKEPDLNGLGREKP